MGFGRGVVTFLSQPLRLMLLQPLLAILLQHRRIRPRLRKRQRHRLPKQIKPLQLVDRGLSLLRRAKDYESLASGSDVLFGDDFDDIADGGEDFFDAFYESRNFDLLVDAADLWEWG